MEVDHARQHLNELSGTLRWLRTLTPGNPRYKVWLGDFVEFTRVVFGLDSPEMAEIRAALAAPATPPGAVNTVDAGRLYLERLDRFTKLMRAMDAALVGATAPPPPRSPGDGLVDRRN